MHPEGNDLHSRETSDFLWHGTYL